MSHSVENLRSQRSNLFVVPPGFHPNATFIGMEKELTELHIRLYRAKKRAESIAAVLICGVTGSGKTHLAREYVHRHRRDYPGGIFWIDAKSFLSISTCYWDIARAAALTNDRDAKQQASTDSSVFVNEVCRWLGAKEEWLLVFDGLSFDEDSQINTFKTYLPPNTKNSSIIYTSVDRTLAKKTRLLEPYCLNVRPLKPEEARRLLFKDLDIKKPTPEQSKKATDIVEYYQCLPLAIHAISHRLTATRKPLERYHIDSHLTDQKLAEPFIGIMEDLSEHSHFEALSLINLLSFFGHHVPVGLITWGKSALDSLNIQIFTSSRSGETGDIDTTLGVLIQYGLIERVSDPYPGRSLISESSTKHSDSPENETVGWSSESFTDSQETTGIYQSTVDVIKIHSVVQGFCRDELHSQDQEMQKVKGVSDPKQKTNDIQGDPSYYLLWLLAATKLFYKSYENARYKMTKDNTGSIFIKDLREYETHAERIMSHYKRANARSHITETKAAKQSLRDVVKDIKKELARISPNASEESLRHEKSIFDRSSSSSSAPSSSMEDSGVSRRSTWNADGEESIKVESPLDMAHPEQPDRLRLELFPPHIYRETTEEKDDGYLTDGEGKTISSRRPSVTPSQLSQITEKPAALDGTMSDESNWKLVTNRKETKAKEPTPKISRFRGRPKRAFRTIGSSYRPSPALTKVSSAQGEGSMSLPSTSFGWISRRTNAQSILAPYHKRQPQGHENTKSSPLAPAPQRENERTWATVAAPPQGPVPSMFHIQSFSSSESAHSALNPNRESPLIGKRPTRRGLGLQTELSIESPSSGQSSSIPSPVSTDFKQKHLNALSQSDPALVPGRTSRDARSDPGSRYHSRHASAVPDTGRDLSTSPPYRLRDLSMEGLNYNQKIAMTSERRFLSPQRPLFHPPPLSDAIHEIPSPVRSKSPNTHPSAIMPGSSPPFAPDGYTSEPLSAPMSRDPSSQSHDSWQTEPTPFSRSISQAPTIGYGYNGYNGYKFPVMDSNGSVMMTQAPSYTVSTGPSVFSPTPQRSRFEYGGEPIESDSNRRIHFGEHEVNVNQARQRVMAWNERQTSAFNTLPTQQVVAPQLTENRPILVEAPAIPSMQSSSRLRAGSCPPEPDYPGLGLRFAPGYPPNM